MGGAWEQTRADQSQGSLGAAGCPSSLYKVRRSVTAAGYFSSLSASRVFRVSEVFNLVFRSDGYVLETGSLIRIICGIFLSPFKPSINIVPASVRFKNL